MILVAGSANLDFVVRASHIPAPGETVLGRDFKIFPGGKGANQAIACARAGGMTTEMLLALGSDAYAEQIEASLAAANVHTHTQRITDQPTGTAFICVSDDAENAITVAPGANNYLSPSHLPALTGFSHLLLQLETPIETVAAYAEAARSQGVKVVLNAAPAQNLPAALLALLDALVVNAGELAILTNHRGTIAESLQRLAVPCVVVTLGHNGCCALADGEFVVRPAFSVTSVDTTAAGDTFCGVLVAALAREQSLPQALRLATAAGALACTRLGAQSSIPSHADVEIFLRNAPATTAAQEVALKKFCGFSQ